MASVIDSFVRATPHQPWPSAWILLQSLSPCPLPFLPKHPPTRVQPLLLQRTPLPARVCSPLGLIPEDCGSPPGSVVRCPSAHKTPFPCQTPGLYCWHGDKANLSASLTPALSQGLITVAVAAASVSPLGLSVLAAFAALFPWHSRGTPDVTS